jgi:hypothetical protein
VAPSGRLAVGTEHLLAVNEQAEGMTCWINHDAKTPVVTVRRLMHRLDPAALDDELNGCV